MADSKADAAPSPTKKIYYKADTLLALPKGPAQRQARPTLCQQKAEKRADNLGVLNGAGPAVLPHAQASSTKTNYPSLPLLLLVWLVRNLRLFVGSRTSVPSVVAHEMP